MKRVIKSSTSIQDEILAIKEQAALYYLETMQRPDQHLSGLVDGIVYTLACIEDKSQYKVFAEIKELANASYPMEK